MLSMERLRISQYLVLDPQNAQKLEAGVDLVELNGLMFACFGDVLRWLALNTNVPLPVGEGIIGQVRTLEWMVKIPKVFRQHLPGWQLIPIPEELKALVGGK